MIKSVNTTMEIVARRTEGFLKGELGLEVHLTAADATDIRTLELRAMTSIVAVGGTVNMLIAFSFEETLIQSVFERYTADITVPPGEEELYMRETAADVVNTIVGNATADLAQGPHAISLSPPVVVTGARSIHRQLDAVFCTVRMTSAAGGLDLNFIGPKDLFDMQLNYVSGTTEKRP